MNSVSRNPFHVSRFTYLLVLLAYLALALALTYPLVAHFDTHVPGSETWAFDEYSFVWSQWWVQRALFDADANLFFTRQVFYPVGVNLVSFTMLWTNAILGLPIQLASGLIPAVNATVLATYVLGAFGMFLLTQYLFQVSGFRVQVDQLETWNLKPETLAAFAAGAVFAFTSSRMVYAALGHYTVLTTQWFPFYILFLIKTIRAPRWKHPILAGLFAALALYSDAAHAPLLVLFTLLYLAFEWRALRAWRVIARLAMIGAATLLFFSPLLLPLFNEIFLSGYQLPGWGHAEKLLVDLAGLLTPTSLHPLNRQWVQELDAVRQGNSRFVDVNTVFLGYATLALALLGALIYRKKLGVWIVAAIAFAILSLGPLLHLNGRSVFDFDGLDATFPMPFLLLHYIPFLKENRVPNRYSIVVILSLAVLVAFAMAWISQRFKVQGSRFALLLPFAFLLLTLFEHLALPLPLTDARAPEVYAQIAREPGEFAILSVPLGWRNSFTMQGAEDTRTQAYQRAHGKSIFSGNTSRNPPSLFEYFDRIALFNSLAQVQMYHALSPETIARDRALAPHLAAFYDIRYVVVNAAAAERLPYSDTRDATHAYLKQVMPLGEKIYERDGVVAYRVNQAQLPATQRVAFGTDAARVYQADGWDRDEAIGGERANWANRASARIVFPIRALADYRVTVRALPFTYPGAPAQTLELIVNAQTIQKFDLKAGWENYAATIPARVLRSGINDLVLRFGYAARPREVVPPNFAIGKTGVTSPVEIVASSAAVASIQVNGREVALGKRGYNVVVLDPQTGAVISARRFDTVDDRAESRAMTDFLAQIPAGQIVALASQGEVAANLGDRTVEQLRTLGAQIDLRQTARRAHVIVGVKGAAVGSAREQAGDASALIAIGRSPDERTLAAAISALTIER
ncbi:MAG: hypothetical protein FJ009_13420 [Chloroflexi bacterium]|nr:hypothetical protein [Chloroflexota bacterium]